VLQERFSEPPPAVSCYRERVTQARSRHPPSLPSAATLQHPCWQTTHLHTLYCLSRIAADADQQDVVQRVDANTVNNQRCGGCAHLP